MRFSRKWEERFLDLTKHVSRWSKDPSTQVGCVIVNDDKRVVGMGYNGFPKGVVDLDSRYEDREQKYPRVVHAEPNAILNATGSVKGCTLFAWPLNTCTTCAALIIQAGIKTVYARNVNSIERPQEKWLKEWAIAREMYQEAKLQVITVTE
jgi:dCMP deaminase